MRTEVDPRGADEHDQDGRQPVASHFRAQARRVPRVEKRESQVAGRCAEQMRAGKRALGDHDQRQQALGPSPLEQGLEQPRQHAGAQQGDAQVQKAEPVSSPQDHGVHEQREYQKNGGRAQRADFDDAPGERRGTVPLEELRSRLVECRGRPCGFGSAVEYKVGDREEPERADTGNAQHHPQSRGSRQAGKEFLVNRHAYELASLSRRLFDRWDGKRLR
jgi:hypothetical protein